jgi:predicted AlkP superfamily pyrophosphatase or phosphodiesterase
VATPKKLVLIVIDGLTPAAFERAVEERSAPALAYLAGEGRYGTAVSVFPSLTPVCLSAIATGGGPDVHHIPHLVWYDRGERQLVEYGSSFGAIKAAGFSRSVLDTIYTMNQRHLSKGAMTVYESLEAAGLVAGAINITCYRGTTKYLPTLPWVTKPAYGPKRFFFYSLFESDRTGAPLAVRNRAAGSVDAYAAAVGRWLVTRDGFDFLAYYLSDYDFASHAHGPDFAEEALGRVDGAVSTLMEAAGGPDEFLERYAVVLCSDHGQTAVSRTARLEDAYARLGADVLVTASNRAGMVYRMPGSRTDAAELARLVDAEPSVDVTLRLEGDEAVARRAGEELRFAPSGDGWETSGDASILDQPDALGRAWSALRNPNAGELLLSAATGYEFADLGGRHHAGGGSHGSLLAGDSLVPMLTLGVERFPTRITEIAPAVLAHFGVEPPEYARVLAHAA